MMQTQPHPTMAEVEYHPTAYRTHTLGQIQELGSDLIGKEVKVCGFMEASRGKGKICFMDIRDGTGRCQIFFKEGTVDENTLTEAQSIARESTVQIIGTVAQKGHLRSLKVSQRLLQLTR